MDQSSRFRYPACDLNMIPHHLTSSDYKLLRLSRLRLALATAAPVGEIHVLDVTRIQFERSWKCCLCWNFVLDQLPGQPDWLFTISLFLSILGSDNQEDPSVCSFWVLHIYLTASHQRRKSRKRLFPLSTTSVFEISHTMLSFWLRSIILWGYAFARLPPPTTSTQNKTQAVASTMALHSNCTLSGIMEWCFWNSDTVFASHYLCDISVMDALVLYQFGPLILVQQLLQLNKHR